MLSSVLVQGDERTVRPTLSDKELDEVRSWVEQLNSDQFEQRRAAFVKLWELGQAALPEVQKAIDSDDLQLSKTAQVLEPLLLAGNAQQLSAAEIYELVFEPNYNRIYRLCENGMWDLANQILDANPQLVETQLAGQPQFLLNRFVHLALNQEDAGLSWPILFKALSFDEERKPIALWIASQLGLDIPTGLSLDEQALMSLFQGKPELALVESASADISKKLITRSFRWELLAQDQSVELLLGDRRGLAFEASRAVLLDYAGQFDASDEVWQRLLQDRPARTGANSKNRVQDGSPMSPGLRLIQDTPGFEKNQLLYALLLAGEVKPIEEYFRLHDPVSCSKFLAVANDHEAIFEIEGLDKDLGNFDAWLRRQSPEIEREARQALSDGSTFSRLSRICSMLVGLGFEEEAERLLKKLMVNADAKSNLWQYGILVWMTQSEQRALLLRNLEVQLNRLPTEIQSIIFGSLYPEISSVVDPLIQTAPDLRLGRGDRVISKLELLEHLYAWDRQYFEAQDLSLSDWIVRARNHIMRKQIARFNSGDLEVAEFADLAKLALGSGYEELAFELVGSEGNSFLAQQEVAVDILLGRGEAGLAASRLRNARRRLTSTLVPQSLLLEERTALLAGEHETAVQVNTARWLSPLTKSRRERESAYADVANDLIDDGEFAAGIAYGKAGFMLAPFGGVDIYWTASDLARALEEEERFDQSADFLRSSLVEALEPNSELVGWQINNGNFHFLRYAAQQERVHRAVANIQSGNMESADRNIKIGRLLQPQDIEMVVQCYPHLLEADERERADRLFESYETVMLEQIESWPNDNTALNNLAWMYACCDRNLEQALELAQKAISGAPNSHIYLDTLAEVHFRAGRFEAALAATKGCIRMDPRERHYRENLIRFAEAMGK